MSKEILNKIVRSLRSGGSEDALFSFKDADTGRQFEIRQYDDDKRFFMSEFRPIGFWSEKEGRRVSEKESDRLKQVESAAERVRRFSEHAKGIGAEVIFGGDGLNVNTIYHESLDACAAAIARSLDEDRFYVSMDLSPKPEPTTEEILHDKQQSLECWMERMKHLQEAGRAPGVFAGLHPFVGKSLNREVKDKILAFINEENPGERHKLWDSLSGACIVGHKTFWQAWTDYDPSAPASKPSREPWPRVPGREDVIPILKRAVQSYRESILERISDLQAEISDLTLQAEQETSLLRAI